MGPRIDRVEVDADHRTVHVSGPIDWDRSGDEESATFAVMIAQVKEGGHIVYAVGRGQREFYPADDRWHGEAFVVDPEERIKFNEPLVTGWAIASVLENGQYKPYGWEVDNLTPERSAATAPQ
jgi:hypothetical protein